MFYAIKVGPIETAEGRINAYIGFCEDGAAPPVMAHRDADGLRQLRQVAHDEDLRCEKKLERAGKPLGFSVAAVPPWAVMGRASLSLTMALGPSVSMRDLDGLMMLSHACAEFWRNRPWKHWHDGQAIEVTTSGALSRRFEGSIMGNGGQEFGLALYEKAGALERIAECVDTGRMELARREDCMAVTLDAEPRFAVDALKDAFGLPRVPFPMRLKGGRPAVMTGIELAVLASAVRAIAAMAPTKGLEANVPIGDVTVHVKAPPPEAR